MTIKKTGQVLVVLLNMNCVTEILWFIIMANRLSKTLADQSQYRQSTNTFAIFIFIFFLFLTLFVFHWSISQDCLKLPVVKREYEISNTIGSMSYCVTCFISSILFGPFITYINTNKFVCPRGHTNSATSMPNLK